MTKTFPNLAIVGATGQVGELMRAILLEEKFEYNSIRFFASQKSAGKIINFAGENITVENIEASDLGGIDIALFSAGSEASKLYAPKFAAEGAYVIDNSSAFRKDETVPLIVSEVNSDHLSLLDAQPYKGGLVANPNCTTMAAMPVLKPLDQYARLKRLIISTYQAVSGTGLAGVDELKEQITDSVAKGDIDKLKLSGDAIELSDPKVYKKNIAYNVVAFAGNLVQDGSLETDEEQKLRHESKKILGKPELLVSGTCVRVPVFTGHSLSVTAEFEKEITPSAAQDILSGAKGVVLRDIPCPLEAAGKNPTFVGRIRQDQSLKNKTGLNLFISCDNLRKGAALNAIEIAKIIKNKYF